MKFRLKHAFTLRQCVVPGTGTVDFMTLQDQTGRAIVLDQTMRALAIRLGADHDLETENSAELTALKLLERDGVVVCADGSSEIPGEASEAEALQFWIQTSDRCNLACSYCYIPSLNSKRSRRADLFSLLGTKLLHVRGLKNVSIKLAGGEPLLCFDEWADEVLKLKKQLEDAGISLSIRIISNLTFLDTRIIEYIKKNDILLSVSLDGAAEFNDRNRVFVKDGKGSSHIISRNIERLESNNIKPSVLITTTPENRAGVAPLVKQLVQKDAAFRISDVKGDNLAPDDFVSAFAEVKEILGEAARDGYPVSRRLVVSDLRTVSPQPHPCSMGTTAAAIYLDGSVYFCHTEFEQGHPLGSLDEEANIVEIIRRGIPKHAGLSDDCQGCEYRLVCAGGCPLYRKNGKSPMCTAYKKIIPMIYEMYENEINEL